ncbi:DUF4147 domain-containing protein [Gimesia chilikensis]|uniref:glycerate kinase type-2 family protein n=1 Tax=Gimesia chilikensis TaxID=2605989 RepID=UPI0011ED2098|nr:DUF4147 domain-containing protein [Gimesia chilikensis]KAA0137927.1 DUF4147 domain-containing protein [Gimesia chilikensis]
MSEMTSLAERALQIWKSGVRAVDSQSLVRQAIQVSGQELSICGHNFPLEGHENLVVVGAGKAGSGMAAGVEAALDGSPLLERCRGWVNVPADCVRTLGRINLYPARPASLNEPTPEGVYGSRQILKMISQLQPDDLCLVLISGGGSALLSAPLPPVTLEDKQAVTRLLMSSGATIQELNCVRKQISQVKGGRLAQAATSGTVIALIISDVVGDPLDIIASGPTVQDQSTPADAVAVLQRLILDRDRIPESVWTILEGKQTGQGSVTTEPQKTIINEIIGSNATALSAAENAARSLGYKVYSLGSTNEGVASEVGVDLAELCLKIHSGQGPVSRPACILSGGEPVVDLSSTPHPGKGGRNQEVVLAALQRLWEEDLTDVCLLSGGTDGEDGPTDAAGGIIDSRIQKKAHELGINVDDYLQTHNAYPCLSQIGGLIKTGATQTNVMDLRVALIG